MWNLNDNTLQHPAVRYQAFESGGLVHMECRDCSGMPCTIFQPPTHPPTHPSTAPWQESVRAMIRILNLAVADMAHRAPHLGDAQPSRVIEGKIPRCRNQYSFQQKTAYKDLPMPVLFLGHTAEAVCTVVEQVPIIIIIIICNCITTFCIDPSTDCYSSLEAAAP